MQMNLSAGQQREQQPTLPSYAEAIRTAPPPSNLPYPPYVNNGPNVQHPTAPYYETPCQPMPYPYSPQTNCNQVVHPSATTCTVPPRYTGNAYTQQSQTTTDEHAPTTIHIIRPVPTETATCCSGRGGRLLAIGLSLMILTAILRATMHSYF